MTDTIADADWADLIEQHTPIDDTDLGDVIRPIWLPHASSGRMETSLDDYRDQRHRITALTDESEPRQRPLTLNTMGHTKLLLVTTIYPAGHQIRIEDPGTAESPDMQQPGGLGLDVGKHVLYIDTMTADDADTTGASVTARIYSGTDHRNLGTRIYNGHLTLTTPMLAIGDALDSPEAMLRIPLNRTGTIPLQIFTRQTIENISGPNEINILLPQYITKPHL